MAETYGDFLADRIRLAVEAGYDSPERIIEGLTELVDYDPGVEAYKAELGVPLAAHVRLLVEAALRSQQSAEATYPAVTDCDRLTSAFNRLRASGIVAAEDVGITMSDVREEMWAALEDARTRGAHPRGWVGFHRQDVERAVDTGVLYLAYAAATDLDEDFALIGNEITDALRSAGLTGEWDGNPNKRIELRDLHWQRRRQGGYPSP